MPAARAAATPTGASSNTRQASGGGLSGNLEAASRKMSGAGFPFTTWSPAQIQIVENQFCFIQKDSGTPSGKVRRCGVLTSGAIVAISQWQ